MKAKESNKIAIRYAKALLESLPVSNNTEILNALKSLALAWEENIELRNVLLNPALGIQERGYVIEDLAKTVTNIGEFSSFLKVLLENGRVSALPQVAKEYEKLVFEMQQTLATTIISATELSDAEKNSIISELSKQLNVRRQTNAIVTWQVDSQLIGGLITKVGDKVLDNTIRGAMDRLRQNLVAM